MKTYTKSIVVTGAGGDTIHKFVRHVQVVDVENNIHNTPGDGLAGSRYYHRGEEGWELWEVIAANPAESYTTNHKRVSIALCIVGAVVAAFAWKIFLK